MHTASVASIFFESIDILSKQEFRALMRAKRKNLSLDPKSQDRCIKLFRENVVLDKASIVAGYYPLGSEISPLPLLKAAAESDCVTALSIIENNKRLLSFSSYELNDELIKGEYGVHSPAIVNYVEPDIIICPLVAFDDAGHRLGQGGGYYDATLEHYRRKKDVLVVGLAYAEQECKSGSFTVEAHDQKMDMVLTPDFIKDFR